MRTVRQLEGVYKEETEALKSMDRNRFVTLQDSKFEVARTYQNHMSQILARKDEIKHADPALKNRIKEVYESFSTLSRKNMEAIERMQRSTERLGNTIRSAAIKSAQSQRTCSYGDNGQISPYAKTKAVSSGFGETV